MVQISSTQNPDIEVLWSLYRKAAELPAGLIRRPSEITRDYLTEVASKCRRNGLQLLATKDNDLVGEIHAYTPDIYAFQHLLTDLSIVVSPDCQGQGIGKQLFTTFLHIVKNEMLHIKRVELFTRSHNVRNVRFYERLGFVNEGAQRDKIYVSEGCYETPLRMAWFADSSFRV